MSFDTRDLQDVCLSTQVAEQVLGPAIARVLVTTIADIEAFDDAEQLIGFFGDQAEIIEGETLCLPLGTQAQLRFTATGRRTRHGEDGHILWSSVTRLKLMFIGGVDD